VHLLLEGMGLLAMYFFEMSMVKILVLFELLSPRVVIKKKGFDLYITMK
jgi:hypothetical protein